MDANSAAIEALATRVNELGRLCARLSQENAEFRRQASWPAVALPSGALPSGGRPMEANVSRRVVGRALGVAAAGAVGSAALVGLGARPAEADNGGSLILGQSNSADSTTVLRHTGAGVPIVALVTTANISPGSSGFSAALAGWAGAGASASGVPVSNGVYGFTDNGDGFGVVGVNHSLVPGSKTGAGVLGQAQVDGGTGIIADASLVNGGIALAAKGGTGIAITANGGNGVVANGNSTNGIGVSATGSVGVLAISSNPSGTGVSGAGDTGVIGDGNSIGIIGQGPTAVQATGTTTGVDASGPTAVVATGVAIGVNATGATAVLATGTMQGVKAHGDSRGGVFSGAAAQVHLAPGSQSTHPKSGERGDLYVDKTGRLWYCKNGGASATWHQIV